MIEPYYCRKMLLCETCHLLILDCFILIGRDIVMSTAYPLERMGFSATPLPTTMTFDLPADAMKIYQVF